MGDWYYGRTRRTGTQARRTATGAPHMHINDDGSIDTLLSCTDYAHGSGCYDSAHVAMFAGTRTRTRPPTPPTRN